VRQILHLWLGSEAIEN